MKFVLSFLNRRINQTRPKYWNAIEPNWRDWINARWISKIRWCFYALTQKSKTLSRYSTMAAHWFQWQMMNWSALHRGMMNSFRMFMFEFKLIRHGSNRLSLKRIMILLLKNNIENKQFSPWISTMFVPSEFILFCFAMFILMFAKHSMCLFA